MLESRKDLFDDQYNSLMKKKAIWGWMICLLIGVG
jgi:hypothetical protein